MGCLNILNMNNIESATVPSPYSYGMAELYSRYGASHEASCTLLIPEVTGADRFWNGIMYV
jgi:hypothetical protein